ncbi:MAG: hypothetical protein JO296_01060 [Pseudonocardiales bacterium]|nr:hypothetical protein [Pseudonocardiales bacterium]
MTTFSTSSRCSSLEKSEGDGWLEYPEEPAEPGWVSLVVSWLRFGVLGTGRLFAGEAFEFADELALTARGAGGGVMEMGVELAMAGPGLG